MIFIVRKSDLFDVKYDKLANKVAYLFEDNILLFPSFFLFIITSTKACLPDSCICLSDL
jgi:hypothetical protein